MRGILGAQQRKEKKLGKVASLAYNVGSLALALECMEMLLVEKGILADNAVMERIKIEATKRMEAAYGSNDGGLIPSGIGGEASGQPGGEGGQSGESTECEIED